MAEIGEESTAPSLEEYQQSSGYLTGPETVDALFTTYQRFERHARGTEGTLAGVHKLSASAPGVRERRSARRELSDCIAQREKRTNRNDTRAKACKSENVPRTADPALMTSSLSRRVYL